MTLLNIYFKKVHSMSAAERKAGDKNWKLIELKIITAITWFWSLRKVQLDNFSISMKFSMMVISCLWVHLLVIYSMWMRYLTQDCLVAINKINLSTVITCLIYSIVNIMVFLLHLMGVRATDYRSKDATHHNEASRLITISYYKR